jgi:hypothetical protein
MIFGGAKLIRPEAVTEAMLTSNVAQADAAWSSVTTYSAGAIKRRALNGIQHRWESQVGSNLNHDPALDDGTNWIDLGASEPYLMFDGAVQSQTENADSIEVAVQFDADRLIDSVYFENLSATALHLTLTDAGEGVVFDETYDLIATSGITDFWAWCFEPVRRLASVVVTDLPPYPGILLEAELTEAGETVKCGALVPGLGRTLGGNAVGGQRSGSWTTRSSRPTTSATSRSLERAYAKTGVVHPERRAPASSTSWSDAAGRLPGDRGALHRDDAYASMVIWGFFKDFSVQVAFPTMSVCTLELESLT